MGSSSKASTNGTLLTRQTDEIEPVTEHDSKTVMLRAERRDRVSVTDVVTRIQREGNIPSEATVVRRTNAYFGPKLVLSSEMGNFVLTAPGPDTQLLLWSPNIADNEERMGWNKLAEVTAVLADDQPQYDLCPQCGQPMQTLEHERRAAVNGCPGPEI